jgi:hypothetical protein
VKISVTIARTAGNVSGIRILPHPFALQERRVRKLGPKGYAASRS